MQDLILPFLNQNMVRFAIENIHKNISLSQKTKDRYKAVYRLEEMDTDMEALAEGMGLSELKLKTKIPFSVYN